MADHPPTGTRLTISASAAVAANRIPLPLPTPPVYLVSCCHRCADLSDEQLLSIRKDSTPVPPLLVGRCTTQERALLMALARHPDTRIPGGQLCQILWGDPDELHSLRVLIHRLRKKLPATMGILNRPHFGYQLVVFPAAQ